MSTDKWSVVLKRLRQKDEFEKSLVITNAGHSKLHYRASFQKKQGLVV